MGMWVCGYILTLADRGLSLNRNIMQPSGSSSRSTSSARITRRLWGYIPFFFSSAAALIAFSLASA